MPVWLEVYSTPLVFLSNTFTGKFLCGRDVGRSHSLRNDVSVRRSILVSQ